MFYRNSSAGDIITVSPIIEACIITPPMLHGPSGESFEYVDSA